MKEYRSAPIAAGEDLTISGVAVVFDQAATVNTPDGSFIEVIERSALANADLSDVKLRIEHDGSKVPLARTPGTLSLEITDKGLCMRASLAGDSPTARDAYAAVKRGDISGMSFGFTVEDDAYDPMTNVRTIRAIKKIYEISLVSDPCYQGTTVSAETRAQVREGNDRKAALRLARQVRAKLMIQRILNKE